MIAADVVQAPNDKQQLEPMLEKIADCRRNWARLALWRTMVFQRGQRERLCRGRDRSGDRDGPRSPSSLARGAFAGAPPPPDQPSPLEAMDHRLKTPEGKRRYALRKQTPEPVFGIIKSVLGFVSFCSAASTTFAASGTS